MLIVSLMNNDLFAIKEGTLDCKDIELPFLLLSEQTI
jgi:hypothetical protein